MNRRASRWVAVALAMAYLGQGPGASAQQPKAEVKAKAKTAERFRPDEPIRATITGAHQGTGATAGEATRATAAQRDAWADVAVFQKAAVWVLQQGEFFDENDVKATLRVLQRGLARRATGRGTPSLDGRPRLDRARLRLEGRRLGPALRRDRSRGAGAHRRPTAPGSTSCSTAGTPRSTRPGSSPPTTASPPPATRTGKITLHVFGRTNNAYRWAGEADVFEAIEAVKRNYPVDERRIVLRGFSMGGAGAWHLGLHHPSLWSSVEAGAGFTETRHYAEAQGRSPQYQEKALHIYDAVDYALNAFDVPIAGYGGEDDPQPQASINIEDALKALGFAMKTEGLVTRGEGIDFLRVVGAKMGHKVDPASRPRSSRPSTTSMPSRESTSTRSGSGS